MEKFTSQSKDFTEVVCAEAQPIKFEQVLIIVPQATSTNG